MDVNPLEAAYDAFEGDLTVECAIAVAHRCLVRVATLPDGRQRRDLVADATNELCAALERNILKDASFSLAPTPRPPSRPTTGIRSITFPPCASAAGPSSNGAPSSNGQPSSNGPPLSSPPASSSARKRLRRKIVVDNSDASDTEPAPTRPRRNPVVRANLVGDDDAGEVDIADNGADRDSDSDFVKEPERTKPTRRSSRLADVQHPPSPEPEPDPVVPAEPPVAELNTAGNENESEGRSPSGSPDLVLPVVRPKPDVPPRPLASDRISKTPVITADDDDTDEEVERSLRAHAPRPRVDAVVISDDEQQQQPAMEQLHQSAHTGVIAPPSAAYARQQPPGLSNCTASGGGQVLANLQGMQVPVLPPRGVPVHYDGNGNPLDSGQPVMRANGAAQTPDIEAELAAMHAQINMANEQQNNWIQGLNVVQTRSMQHGSNPAFSNQPQVQPPSGPPRNAGGRYVASRPIPHVAQPNIHNVQHAAQEARLANRSNMHNAVGMHRAALVEAQRRQAATMRQQEAQRNALHKQYADRIAAEAAALAIQRRNLAILRDQQEQLRLDDQLAQLDRQQQLIQNRKALILRQQRQLQAQNIRQAQARAARLSQNAHQPPLPAAQNLIMNQPMRAPAEQAPIGRPQALDRVQVVRQAELARIRREMAQVATARQAAAQQAAAQQAAAQRVAAKQEAERSRRREQAVANFRRQAAADNARLAQPAVEQPGQTQMSQAEVDRLCAEVLGQANAAAGQPDNANAVQVSQNAGPHAQVMQGNGEVPPAAHGLTPSPVKPNIQGGNHNETAERSGPDQSTGPTSTTPAEASSQRMAQTAGNFVYNRVALTPEAKQVKTELLAAESSDPAEGAPDSNGNNEEDGSVANGVDEGTHTAANGTGEMAGVSPNGTGQGAELPATPTANGSQNTAGAASTQSSALKGDLLNWDIENLGRRSQQSQE